MSEQLKIALAGGLLFIVFATASWYASRQAATALEEGNQARRERPRVAPIVVLLLGAILLAVTNPSQADFSDFLQRQMASQGSSSADPFITGLARLVTGGMAASAERRDLALFSVYRLKLDRSREQWWIGVLKQFIPLPKGSAL